MSIPESIADYTRLLEYFADRQGLSGIARRLVLCRDGSADGVVVVDLANEIGSVSVMTFGAKGDSTTGADGTDDTAAIQAAVNYCAAAFVPLRFPPNKIFRVTNTINLTSSITIVGSGSPGQDICMPRIHMDGLPNAAASKPIFLSTVIGSPCNISGVALSGPYAVGIEGTFAYSCLGNLELWVDLLTGIKWAGVYAKIENIRYGYAGGGALDQAVAIDCLAPQDDGNNRLEYKDIKVFRAKGAHGVRLSGGTHNSVQEISFEDCGNDGNTLETLLYLRGAGITNVDGFYAERSIIAETAGRRPLIQVGASSTTRTNAYIDNITVYAGTTTFTCLVMADNETTIGNMWANGWTGQTLVPSGYAVTAAGSVTTVVKGRLIYNNQRPADWGTLKSLSPETGGMPQLVDDTAASTWYTETYGAPFAGARYFNTTTDAVKTYTGDPLAWA